MQADVLVSLLTMSVEPTDSSYMPSLVTVSGGNSAQSLHELRTVTIEPDDRRVILLDNLTQVIRCFTGLPAYADHCTLTFCFGC